MDPEKKARLGQRWSCYSCAGKFYDLNKPEPICPRCGADQRESPQLEEVKRPRKAVRKAPAKKQPPPALLDDEDEIAAVADSEGGEQVPELDLEAGEELADVSLEEE